MTALEGACLKRLLCSSVLSAQTDVLVVFGQLDLGEGDTSKSGSVKIMLSIARIARFKTNATETSDTAPGLGGENEIVWSLMYATT